MRLKNVDEIDGRRKIDFGSRNGNGKVVSLEQWFSTLKVRWHTKV